MDSISRECIRDDIGMYLYKGVIRIGSLGMIDILAVVSLCGFDSVKTNAIINGKINTKRLKFNKNKCVKLHISKSKSLNCCKTQIGDSEQKMVSCIKLQVQDSEMKQETSEKYIGDVILAEGSNNSNIEKRTSRNLQMPRRFSGNLKICAMDLNKFKVLSS